MKTDVRMKQPSSDLRFFFRGEGFAAEMALMHQAISIVLLGSKARVRKPPQSRVRQRHFARLWLSWVS